MSTNLSKLNFFQIPLGVLLAIAILNIIGVSINFYTSSLENSYVNTENITSRYINGVYVSKKNVYDMDKNRYGFIQKNIVSERYTGAIIAYGFIAMSCIISIVWIEITKAKLTAETVPRENPQRDWI